MWALLTFLALLRVQFVISSSNQTLLFGSFTTSVASKPPHNVPNLLATLTSQASKTKFYNSSFGDTSDQIIFGLYLCRGDIDYQACSDCVNYAANVLLKHCINATQAKYWYDHCMVRYSNEPFFGKVDEHSWGASWSFGKLSSNLTSNKIHFAEIVGGIMNNLAFEGANDKCGEKFATTRVRLNRFEWLYAMVQCTWDLTACDCNKCLSNAMGHLQPLRGNANGAKIVYSSCMVRYEIYPFFKIMQSKPTLAIQ